MSLLPHREPFDEEFRTVGMTGEARKFPRSERQIRIFAAWLGIEPENMMDAMKYFANAQAKKSWEAAEVAAQHYHNSNPPTIMVGMIYCQTSKHDGVLAIRRSLPGFGHGLLALPGGFQEMGEDWRWTLTREVLEETNVRVNPEGWKVHHMCTVENGSRNLMFAAYNHEDYPFALPEELTPTEEASEVLVWVPKFETGMSPRRINLTSNAPDWGFETHLIEAYDFYIRSY